MSTEPDADIRPALGEALATAKPVCEHYWAYHCYRGMSLRLCQLCHEPDWDDLERQLGGNATEGGKDLTVTLGLDPHTGHPVTFRAKISDIDNPHLGWRRIEPIDGYIDVPAQWLESRP